MIYFAYNLIQHKELQMFTVEIDTGFTKAELRRFEAWFDEEIGTDYEVNECDFEELFYVTCYDVTEWELQKIQAFEDDVYSRRDN